MYFADRTFLYLILPVMLCLILLIFFASLRRRRLLSNIIDPELIPSVIPSSVFRFRTVKNIFLFLSVLFFFSAMARPQWGSRTQEMSRKGLDIIIAVDTSFSMLAEDLKPNRLARARYEIGSFINGLKGDRIGLLTFAGSAFMQCPLTLDYNAAVQYLDMLDAYSMPTPGTAIGKAVRRAVKSFNQQEFKHKVLILITDGEDHEGDPLAAAREAKKNGVIIYTIGIGSATGEPIPIRDSEGVLKGYRKDRQGNVITSRLNDNDLKRIALETGGKYFHASAGAIELRKIHEEISSMEKKELSGRVMNMYEEKFMWFLLPGLIFFLVYLALPERSFAVWRRKK